MDWPHVSPDLSLIENVWSVAELILHKAYKCRNLKEFKKAAKQAWDSVTSDVDFKDICSVPCLAGCRSASREVVIL